MVKGASFVGVTETVTVINSEEAVPRSSVATALKVCVPTGGLLQSRLKGGLLTTPSELVPSRNSTRATVPSRSLAVACRVIGCGLCKTLSFVGLSHCTLGA